jgi:hypothetical protein
LLPDEPDPDDLVEFLEPELACLVLEPEAFDPELECLVELVWVVELL